METKELQRQCVELTAQIDKKLNITRDPYLAFTQLIEEVGELAVDINLPKLRNKETDMVSLKSNFADIFLLLSALADLYDIDIETAMTEKIKIIKGRHGL